MQETLGKSRLENPILGEDKKKNPDKEQLKASCSHLSKSLKESKICIYGSSCHAVDPRRSQVPDAHFRLKSQGTTRTDHTRAYRKADKPQSRFLPQDKLEKEKPN